MTSAIQNSKAGLLTVFRQAGWRLGGKPFKPFTRAQSRNNIFHQRAEHALAIQFGRQRAADGAAGARRWRGLRSARMRGRAIADASMGVLGMQERATLIQWHLDIQTEAGQGSTVVLRCPLRIRE
jgi:hypothetical protein